MRITNIDNLSALLDRLATERIKEYNFEKQGKTAGFSQSNHTR